MTPSFRRQQPHLHTWTGRQRQHGTASSLPEWTLRGRGAACAGGELRGLELGWVHVVSFPDPLTPPHTSSPKGADATIRNCEGKCAEDVAAAANNDELMEKLHFRRRGKILPTSNVEVEQLTALALPDEAASGKVGASAGHAGQASTERSIVGSRCSSSSLTTSTPSAVHSPLHGSNPSNAAGHPPLLHTSATTAAGHEPAAMCGVRRPMPYAHLGPPLVPGPPVLRSEGSAGAIIFQAVALGDVAVLQQVGGGSPFLFRTDRQLTQGQNYHLQILDADPSLAYIKDERGDTPVCVRAGRHARTRSRDAHCDQSHAYVRTVPPISPSQLHIAARRANLYVALTLIRHSAVDAKVPGSNSKEKNRRGMCKSCSINHPVLQALVETVNAGQSSPIFDACASGHLQLIRELISIAPLGMFETVGPRARPPRST